MRRLARVSGPVLNIKEQQISVSSLKINNHQTETSHGTSQKAVEGICMAE